MPWERVMAAGRRVVNKPVYQLVVAYPEAGINAVLADLLAVELPPGMPERIAVAGLRVASERASDIGRMTRRGRVFDHAELRAVLEHSAVRDGWFFFGAPLAKGEPVEPVDVPQLLERSAFVADVMEGNWVGARTVRPDVADALRGVIVGAREVEACELEAVRLMY
jgi:hypothetical protein